MRLDLSLLLGRLGEDMIRRLPELAHIDPGCVLFLLSRSRGPGLRGVYARIVPMRFAGGEQETVRRRGRWRETFRMPRLRHDDREILYLIYVSVPRFLRLSRREKLLTLLHELFHISPACDGDIRRFPGRNFAHGSSRRSFDRLVGALLTRYLESAPDERLLAALDLEEQDWQAGRVRLDGLRLPLPRPALVGRQILPGR